MKANKDLDEQINEILYDFDTSCPECYDEGHGGEGCAYCWNHPVKQQAIDKTKQQLKALIEEREHMSKLALLHHLKSQAKTEVVVTLGVFENKEFVPMRVIDDEIRKFASDTDVTHKTPTDKQIQDILVAYKRRDAYATGATGTTLKRAIEMIRELYEDGAK